MGSQSSMTTNEVATYGEELIQFEEKNPHGLQRKLYWRDRPVQISAKSRSLQSFPTHPTLTHRGIQVGEDYICELAVQDGKVGYQISMWKVPEKQGATSVGIDTDSGSDSSRGPFIVEQVVQEMNDGKGRSLIDSLTHPVRNLKRLYKPWRDAHRYDEAFNNCQDFPKQLVERIKADGTDNTMAKKPTGRSNGRLPRAEVYSSSAQSTLAQKMRVQNRQAWNTRTQNMLAENTLAWNNRAQNMMIQNTLGPHKLARNIWPHNTWAHNIWAHDNSAQNMLVQNMIAQNMLSQSMAVQNMAPPYMPTC